MLADKRLGKVEFDPTPCMTCADSGGACTCALRTHNGQHDNLHSAICNSLCMLHVKLEELGLSTQGIRKNLQQSKSGTEPELRPTCRPTGGADRQGMSNATVEATSKGADDLSRAKSHSVRLTLQDLCVLCLQCLLSSLQLSPLKVHLFGPLHQPVSFCCGCIGLVSLTLNQRIFLCLQRVLLLFMFCSMTEAVLSVATSCKLNQRSILPCATPFAYST